MSTLRDNDELEGCSCNLVQCPYVSSSSITNNNNIIIAHSLFPQCRSSYRNDNNNNNNTNYYCYYNTYPSIRILYESYNNEAYREINTKNSLGLLAVIFSLSLVGLAYFYSRFPEVTEDEKRHMKLPWNIEDAKQLGIVLDKYKQDHYFSVLGGVFVTYIFLQTFAIPGSLFLSILSGFLFPFLQALLLVCLCSALGASLCFMLSQLFGRKLVKKYFPDRAKKWSVIVNKHRDHLFNYIVFLRVTPFLPNWFINLSAPVIGVPLVPFATGTFFGVAPPSFVAIQTGQTLYQMSSSDMAFSWNSVLLLAAFAFISLIPIFLKEKLKDKLE